MARNPDRVAALDPLMKPRHVRPQNSLQKLERWSALQSDLSTKTRPPEDLAPSVVAALFQHPHASSAGDLPVTIDEKDKALPSASHARFERRH